MTGFEYFLAVTSTILSVGMLIIVSLALVAVLEIRRLRNRTHGMFKRAELDMKPFLAHARDVVVNADTITSALVTHVGRIGETVSAATNTADEAIAATRLRLNELMALIDVVQGEAEHLFVSTASTVHGIQHGAATFRGRGMKFASDELDASEPDDGLDTQLDPQEDGDGHDVSESTAQAPAVGPRIRSRDGRRRRA